jgi:hypothetical protein
VGDRVGADGVFTAGAAQADYSLPYSTYVGNALNAKPVEGLSPEGILDSSLAETVGGMKFTCNLNMGLFQQNQNLPLLFSGGLILELYTAPFERCISFTSIYSKVDPVDFPNLRDSDIRGSGHLVDVSAMNCVLPTSMSTAFGWAVEETGGKIAGQFLDISCCGYALDNMRYEGIANFGSDEIDARTTGSGDERKIALMQSKSEDFRLTERTGKVDAVQYTAVTGANTTQVTVPIGQKLHYNNNIAPLTARMQQFLTGWSYELTNVELRADMLQFSQSYDESVAEIVDSDEGLPITFQTFSTQKTIYDGNRQTLTLNERARSIQFALAVFKDPKQERKTHELLMDDDSRYMIASRRILNVSSVYYAANQFLNLTAENSSSSSLQYKYVGLANPYTIFARVLPIQAQEQALFPNLIDYQYRIGTRFIPASPVDCSAGAVQAYIELMKAIGMYGSFSGTGQRANMPGNRIVPDLYSKRICTAASKVLAGAYYTVTGAANTVRTLVFGDLESKDYVGSRYRIPQRFILGQNFSDIPDHASGVDTATQALAIELTLNGNAAKSDIEMNYNCYVFLNVRRDMFVRCGGQIEILY